MLAFKVVGLHDYTVLSMTLPRPAKADCKVSKETCPTLGRHPASPGSSHAAVFVASVPTGAAHGTAAVKDCSINPSHSSVLDFPTPPFSTHRIRDERM